MAKKIEKGSPWAEMIQSMEVEAIRKKNPEEGDVCLERVLEENGLDDLRS